jgi:hypothetical protein
VRADAVFREGLAQKLPDRFNTEVELTTVALLEKGAANWIRRAGRTWKRKKQNDSEKLFDLTRKKTSLLGTAF